MAEEGRGVIHVQQAHQGGGQIDLTGDAAVLASLNQARCVDEQWDVVVVYRQVFHTGAAGGVVGHEDEDRVVEPGLLTRLLEELANGVVGVLHCTFTAGAGRNVDAAFRVGVGAMVGGGHQLQQERLACGCIGVSQLQGLLVQVFIAHAPGVGKGHLVVGYAGLIDHAVAVAGEEGVHVVEVAAATVNEHAVITLRRELLAEAGKAGFAADALDDRATGGRRDRQGDGFQTPGGAGAGGVKLVEVEALLAQGIEVWRQITRIAFAAQVLGAEAFDGDQNQVQLARLARVVDLAANAHRLAVDKAGVRLADFITQAVGGGCLGQLRVELRVVQLVVPEGGKELVRPVTGKLVLVSVAARAAREVLANDDNAQGDRGHGASQADATLGPAQQGGCSDATHAWLQRRRGNHCNDGQSRQQGIDRVGLKDVVDHLVGVDQIVDRDEVETHTELIPEQPFGHGGKQHQEHADGHGHLQHPQMPALAPEPARAQQQVKRQWRQGVKQEADIVYHALAVQAQHAARAELGFAQMGQQQDRAGNEENPEPEGCEQAKEAGLGGFEQGHVTVRG